LSPIWTFLPAGAASYLLGSIPFGYLLARTKGIDIRRVGSGNIGATNVFRCAGKSLGLLTFSLDVLKGFVPAFCFPPFISGMYALPPGQGLPVLCACLAVVGHNWPVYLHFKGGKGVATSAGALLGIAPTATGIGLMAWALLFLLTRYVSVASMLTAVIIAGLAWALYFEQGILLPIALTALAALAIWRHKSNIQRLLKGTENRFQFGGTTPRRSRTQR